MGNAGSGRFPANLSKQGAVHIRVIGVVHPPLFSLELFNEVLSITSCRHLPYHRREAGVARHAMFTNPPCLGLEYSEVVRFQLKTTSVK